MSLRRLSLTAAARHSTRLVYCAATRSRKRHRTHRRLEWGHILVASVPIGHPSSILFYSSSGDGGDAFTISDAPHNGASRDARKYVDEIFSLFDTGGYDAGPKAEMLLMSMEKAAENDEDVQPPPILLYNKVISMYGRCSRGYDAERLLRHMLSKQESAIGINRSDWAQPDSITYNTCIAAWASSRGSAIRAEGLLREMLDCHSMGNANVQPDSHSFNTVIAAYMREDRSHDRFNAIIQLMIQYSERPDSNVKLDTITFSSIITLLAKSRRRGAARQALAILERMEALYIEGNTAVKPDGITYSSAITALAKSGEKDAAEKALRIFQHMEHQYSNHGDFSIKPDTVTFNAVLDAFANVGERGSAERAQSLLQLMHHRYEAGNTDVRPNTVSYATVMLAWKNSQDAHAADKAEALLRRLQDLYREGDECMEPNTVCFSTVISAYAKVGTRRAAERAEALLDEMNELYMSGLGSVQPNAITYTSVVEAWASTGDSQAVDRAESIVRKMEKLSREGNAVLSPNTITYNTLIKAIEKSRIQDKAQKAEKILTTMRSLCDSGVRRVTPNVRTYNAVLQACAATEGSKEVKHRALELVLGLLQEMRRNDSDFRPDNYTYPTALKACGNLSGDSNLMRDVFDYCREDGMVDVMVLSHVRRVAPGYLEQLTKVPATKLRIHDVPSQWTRSIRKIRQKWI